MVHLTNMTDPNTTEAGATKKAALNGLAIVGFGALIVAGIFLAIYAARYVPETLSRLSSAVILSSPDTDETSTNEDEPAIEEEQDEIEDAEETTSAPTTPPRPTVTTPVVTTPRPTVPSGPRLYGLPDLTIVDAEVGYMRGSTFEEDDEVPRNRDAAVRFYVKNNGTNIAGGWRIRVDVEGERPVTGTGGVLFPNGTQEFLLQIEDPEEGENLRIEIEADYQDDLDESNERNNDEDVDIDIDR